MLEAMQEQTVTVANQTYKLPAPFFVLATQNPLEMEGTYPLPEAQLDRFLFKVNILFPSAEDLNEILARTTGQDTPSAEAAADGGRIIEMQQLARQVPVPSNVSQYISRFIVGTHPGRSSSNIVNQYVRYGSSPRGAQALVLGAKITALFAGRYNVSFDDVTAVAKAALRHRLLLNFEGQAEGIQTDDVIADLITNIPKE
jgi:MoxR-like ATPase